MAGFKHEQPFWSQGKLVAGLDEVGRGAFAGPVVTACVVFDTNTQFPKKIIINDSKKLTTKQREKSSIWIQQNALFWSISSSSVTEINQKGIVKATHIAYRRAIGSCELGVENLLLDAFYVPRLRGFPKNKQNPIIKGDQKSVSIAAASIIAKVHRDQLMTKLSAEFKPYHWHKNKGYGTPAHRNAISKHGATKHHRELYVRNILHPLIPSSKLEEG